MSGNESRVEAGEHSDPAQDGLQQDADQRQHGDAEQSATTRCPAPYRDDHQQRSEADRTGQGPVAELDELVKPLFLVGDRDERSRDALWPRRAAEARAGQSDEPAGDDDADFENQVDQEDSAQPGVCRLSGGHPMRLVPPQHFSSQRPSSRFRRPAASVKRARGVAARVVEHESQSLDRARPG
jgi:hypothetical protein